MPFLPYSYRLLSSTLGCLMLLVGFAQAEEAENADSALTTVKYQVTGLFIPERAQDLRDLVASLDGVTLVSVDYNNAEAIFVYDPPVALPHVQKPEQYPEQFVELIGRSSHRTFMLKPLSTTPKNTLQWVEIPVAGLDCKGCSYAAYCVIYELEGVQQATASFKRGLVTALIDPEKTSQAALEKILEEKNVKLAKDPQ